MNIASDMKLSQFDLISTPTGNDTIFLNHGESLQGSKMNNCSVGRRAFHLASELPPAEAHGGLRHPGREDNHGVAQAGVMQHISGVRSVYSASGYLLGVFLA